MVMNVLILMAALVAQIDRPPLQPGQCWIPSYYETSPYVVSSLWLNVKFPRDLSAEERVAVVASEEDMLQPYEAGAVLGKEWVVLRVKGCRDCDEIEELKKRLLARPEILYVAPVYVDRGFKTLRPGLDLLYISGPADMNEAEIMALNEEYHVEVYERMDLSVIGKLAFYLRATKETPIVTPYLRLVYLQHPEVDAADALYSYSPYLDDASGPVAPGAEDVDGSGRVDAVDVQVVVNRILGREAKGETDVNGDCHDNARDLQLVVNALLGFPSKSVPEAAADALAYGALME